MDQEREPLSVQMKEALLEALAQHRASNGNGKWKIALVVVAVLGLIMISYNFLSGFGTKAEIEEVRQRTAIIYTLQNVPDDIKTLNGRMDRLELLLQQITIELQLRPYRRIPPAPPGDNR